MPIGELHGAARMGALKKVRTLITDRAIIDEKDEVSDGAGTRVAPGS